MASKRHIHPLGIELEGEFTRYGGSALRSLTDNAPSWVRRVLTSTPAIVTCALALEMALAGTVCAQLELVPDKEPQSVFSGDGRQVSVIWRNPGQRSVSSELSTRIYQSSSSTAILVGEVPWKRLEVLPGQTIIESVTLSFPSVRAETRFLVQWVEAPNKLRGVTDILVYPAALLKDLRPLAADEPLGIFDPQNEVKPLLKSAALDFVDLEDTGFASFSGKLAIIGPFQSKAEMHEGLPRQVKKLAKKGAAVVWICPPPRREKELKPSFYVMVEGRGAVAVVRADLIANLRESPQSQLNLVQLARLGVRPEPLRLPYSGPDDKTQSNP